MLRFVSVAIYNWYCFFGLNRFCRLSGLSPFMGATDIETMANVTIAKYDFDDEAFLEISDNAKDFIKSLLLKDMK